MQTGPTRRSRVCGGRPEANKLLLISIFVRAIQQENFCCTLGYWVMRRGSSPLLVPALFIPGLDPLIQRLQHPRIHGGDDVDGGVEFFFGHPRFPCVRKAAFDSGFAKAHHRHGQTDEHLFPFGEALDGMSVAIERFKISLFHGAELLSKIAAEKQPC